MATISKINTISINNCSASSASVTIGKYDVESTFEKLEKKCKKLEEIVNLLVQFAPEDVKKSIELALELDEKED